jgi:hypothetical protein
MTFKQLIEYWYDNEYGQAIGVDQPGAKEHIEYIKRAKKRMHRRRKKLVLAYWQVTHKRPDYKDLI